MNHSSSAAAAFDPFSELTHYARQLSALSTPSSSDNVFYDIMSDGLAWRDETDDTTPVRVVWALRFIIAYRTSLMLDRPRTDLADVWNHACSQFPDWVGFRPERRQPTPQLIEVYRRGSVSTRKCIRALPTTVDGKPDDVG